MNQQRITPPQQYQRGEPNSQNKRKTPQQLYQGGMAMVLSINEPWITGKVRCQNGYAYIDKPFWNADKGQADHKREYIGKYDGHSFKPNKNYYRLKAEYEQSLVPSKTAPV